MSTCELCKKKRTGTQSLGSIVCERTAKSQLSISMAFWCQRMRRFLFPQWFHIFDLWTPPLSDIVVWFRLAFNTLAKPWPIRLHFKSTRASFLCGKISNWELHEKVRPSASGKKAIISFFLSLLIAGNLFSSCLFLNAPQEPDACSSQHLVS